MTLRALRIERNGVMGGAYTLLPSHTIADFEALDLGENFTYHHDRARVGHCWECDRPIWEGQAYLLDEDECDIAHEACFWGRAARREFERNLWKARYVVAVYECDREMGGPEEEGWSYETGLLVTSIAVDSLDAAEMIREGLTIEYPYTGRRGYYSKREPDYSVTILDRHEGDEWLDERLEPVSYYPVRIPHYC